jgi:hypothetical protein
VANLFHENLGLTVAGIEKVFVYESRAYKKETSLLFFLMCLLIRIVYKFRSILEFICHGFNLTFSSTGLTMLKKEKSTFLKPQTHTCLYTTPQKTLDNRPL